MLAISEQESVCKKTVALCVILCCILISCRSRPVTFPLNGIYTTYKPSIIQRVILERKIQGSIYPLPVAMLYLRPDNIYVMGFCDNQVREAGRYTAREDSILLYDRHQLITGTKLPDNSIFIDRKNQIVYFTRPGKKSQTNIKGIIPLKRNNKYAHYGFLRGQDMSFDSLLYHYEQRSIEEQNKWSDSVLKDNT